MHVYEYIQSTIPYTWIWAPCLAVKNKRQPGRVMDRLVRLLEAIMTQCIHTQKQCT